MNMIRPNQPWNQNSCKSSQLTRRTLLPQNEYWPLTNPAAESIPDWFAGSPPWMSQSYSLDHLNMNIVQYDYSHRPASCQEGKQKEMLFCYWQIQGAMILSWCHNNMTSQTSLDYQFGDDQGGCIMRQVAGKRHRGFSLQRKEAVTGWLFVTPLMLGYLVFTAFSMVYSLYI